MKILLVSWSILPRTGGSSVIVENLAQCFSKSELVVLGGAPLFGSKAHARGPNDPKFVYFPSEISLLGRGARYFESIRKWRFQSLVKKLKDVIRLEKIDRVIGIYPDAFYCLAACRAAKAERVPFYAYFHNTYIENKEITDPKAPLIQREIFDTSKFIFVMSKGMQQYYNTKYSGYQQKFIPLVHTFHEYPDPANLSGIPGVDKKHYNLVAIGNFNESNMEATRRFVEAIGDHPKFSLSLYTHVPPLLLQQRGLKTRLITHKGFVKPGDVLDALQAYDICVLTHGFTGGYGPIEYQTIFPTRTIPLLLSGKPIIAHSPKHSFLNDFIAEHQCAELVDEPQEEAVLAGLERIAGSESYQKKLVGAARKTARLFHGPRVVEELRALLKSV